MKGLSRLFVPPGHRSLHPPLCLSTQEPLSTCTHEGELEMPLHLLNAGGGGGLVDDGETLRVHNHGSLGGLPSNREGGAGRVHRAADGLPQAPASNERLSKPYLEGNSPSL